MKRSEAREELGSQYFDWLQLDEKNRKKLWKKLSNRERYLINIATRDDPDDVDDLQPTSTETTHSMFDDLIKSAEALVTQLRSDGTDGSKLLEHPDLLRRLIHRMTIKPYEPARLAYIAYEPGFNSVFGGTGYDDLIGEIQCISYRFLEEGKIVWAGGIMDQARFRDKRDLLSLAADALGSLKTLEGQPLQTADAADIDELVETTDYGLPGFPYIERNSELTIDSIKYGMDCGFQNFEPIAFEQLIGFLFAKLGFSVRHTKASGDFGADLLVSKGEVSTAVQVKRYAVFEYTGKKAVDEVLSAKAYYKCDRALCVSTSLHYSKAAVELASSTGVELWNWESLIQNIRVAFGSDLGDWVSDWERNRNRAYSRPGSCMALITTIAVLSYLAAVFRS